MIPRYLMIALKHGKIVGIRERIREDRSLSLSITEIYGEFS